MIQMYLELRSSIFISFISFLFIYYFISYKVQVYLSKGDLTSMCPTLTANMESLSTLGTLRI